MVDEQTDYGIDAPGLVKGFFVAGAIAAAVAALAWTLGFNDEIWLIAVLAIGIAVAVYAFGMAASCCSRTGWKGQGS